MIAPVVLRADNFTPPSRTPWGGTRILERYKAHLGIRSAGVVGESWEVSVEPSFPSRIAGADDTLAERIAAAPRAWLGADGGEQTPLLVKLLDAAQHLSVQVHPADDDAALLPGESGKPEAWVILAAEPGAGLYLGFRDGVGRHDVEGCLRGGGALDQLMRFVPVAPGDAFLIEAGTPHAIGAGVTLLEPQHVAPGRRGVTYRFWDWNRRYDAAGVLDPQGTPRELHVERSLAVTRWGATARRSERAVLASGSIARTRVIDWRWFEVEEWTGTGTATLENDRLVAVTCLGGRLDIETEFGSLSLRAGESGVLPACAPSLGMCARDLWAFAARAGCLRAGFR